MGRILEGSLGGAKDIEKPVPKIICTVKMQRFKHFQVYTLVTFQYHWDFGFWRTLIMQRWRSCKKNVRQYLSDHRNRWKIFSQKSQVIFRFCCDKAEVPPFHPCGQIWKAKVPFKMQKFR